MHESGIMHRDIKPGNLLVDQAGNLKVADFGLSKFICGKINEDYDLTDFVVTRWYRPPELTMRYSNEKYDEKIDMWSVGCVAYEMLTQEILFQSTEEEQNRKTMSILGKPDKDLIRNIKSQRI